jgi:hypothetical protein
MWIHEKFDQETKRKIVSIMLCLFFLTSMLLKIIQLREYPDNPRESVSTEHLYNYMFLPVDKKNK